LSYIRVRHSSRTGTKRRWPPRLACGILAAITGANDVLKRPLFVAYGAACYLIFLATFLYAIAFGIRAQRADAAAGGARAIADAAPKFDHACGNGPCETPAAAPPTKRNI
jgi:hypothetical protein